MRCLGFRLWHRLRFEHKLLIVAAQVVRLDMELDKSKQMLQQRCRELLGSDLAELRIQKTERKAAVNGTMTMNSRTLISPLKSCAKVERPCWTRSTAPTGKIHRKSLHCEVRHQGLSSAVPRQVQNVPMPVGFPLRRFM